MSLGGGWFEYFNKVIPGFYSRTRTISDPVNEAEGGIVAGGIISDWALEDEIFEITKNDFYNDPVSVTGHSYDDPRNFGLRELFRHANKLIAYKLNGGSVKASNDIVGSATKAGSVGNGISVSVVRNILDENKFDVTTYLDGAVKDEQTVSSKSQRTFELSKGAETAGETIPKTAADIEVDGLNVTVTYSNLTLDYDTTATIVKKAGSDVTQSEGIVKASEELVDTITFSKEAGDGQYTVEARVKKTDADEYVTLKTKTVTLTNTPETIKLTKGGETPGDEINAPSVAFNVDGLKVEATYADLLADYDSVSTIVKKVEEDVTSSSGISKVNEDLKDTITFTGEADDATYKIEARVKKTGQEEYVTLKTLEVTLSTTPETLKLEKTNEEDGETVDSTTVDIAVEGLKATLTYASLGETYTTLKTQVTKEGQPYSEHVQVQTAELVDTVTFDSSAPKGEYKIEARLQNTSGEEDYKVIKTYTVEVKTDSPEVVSLAKGQEQEGTSLSSASATFAEESLKINITYQNLPKEFKTASTAVKKDGEDVTQGVQITPEAVTFEETAQKGVYTIVARAKANETETYKTLKSLEVTIETDQPEKTDLADGDTSDGNSVPNASVNFEVRERSLVVTYANLPKDFPSISTIITKDELETSQGFLKTNKALIDTFEFDNTAEAGTYKIQARIKKSNSEIKTLATLELTVVVNESGIVGADGEELKDNDYVVFTDDLIPESAGYNFTNGQSVDTITIGDHTNFLNKLEGYSYNMLFADSVDAEVKALYQAFTERLRDGRGLYFQTALYSAGNADYEGIVSVYNSVTEKDYVKKSSLVYWTAGFLSSLALEEEGTNHVYDGELEIDTNISQARLELLMNSGEFVFHKTDLTEVRTLIDVNTFRSFTDVKNKYVSNNKVVRIVDYIHNTLAKIINKANIGHTLNTKEGRDVIFVRSDEVFKKLNSRGAIKNYTESDIEVLPVDKDPEAVQVSGYIDVSDTIRKVYFTTNIRKTQN